MVNGGARYPYGNIALMFYIILFSTEFNIFCYLNHVAEFQF